MKATKRGKKQILSLFFGVEGLRDKTARASSQICLIRHVESLVTS